MARCEVIDSDVQGVEVRVQQGGSLSGVIVVEGSSDPAVLARISQFQFHIHIDQSRPLAVPDNSELKVSPDGSFRVRGLQPCRVKIEMQRYADINSFFILRVERDGVPPPHQWP